MSERLVNEGEATGSSYPTLKRALEVIGGIPVMITLVLGAVILAEGVYGLVTGNALFYQSLEPSFKFILGFIVLTLTSDKVIDLAF